jgi:hypothetical protein
MLQEHLRRQQAAAERDAEAEREAKREMDRQAELERRRQVEARACERFGDDAPLPGDLELADALIGQIKRGGVPVSWLAALARGEHWAAKYCRLMALAERVRRALVQGQVSWDDALAATKLIVIDEQTARHRIADMDRPAEYTDGHPPEAFWRTLWKINRACGLDVPADVFFPEDHAAALQRIDPAAGAMLADASAVMKREFEQKFWAERAAKGWLVPAPQSQPPAAPEIKEEERKQ